MKADARIFKGLLGALLPVLLLCPAVRADYQVPDGTVYTSSTSPQSNPTVIAQSGTVTANNVTVQAGANVTFNATTSIVLGPGFSATGGTNGQFIAAIVSGLAPVITSPTSASGSTNSTFRYVITATNNPTTFGLTGTLPIGLSFASNTGLITGVPDQVGTSTVTISASNSAGTGSATLTITIGQPSVTFTASPTTFTYNGSSQGPTLTISPSNATYSTSGALVATNAGSYSFTATGTGSYSGSQTFDWTIGQASQPGVAIQPSSGQTISVGQSLTFSASGGAGVGAFVWGGAASGGGSTQTVSFNTAGTFSVSVYRAGDTNYVQSNTATVGITVTTGAPPSLKVLFPTP